MSNREILMRRKRIERDLREARERASAEARKVRAPAEAEHRRAMEALAQGRTEVSRGVTGVDVSALVESARFAEQKVAECKAQDRSNRRAVKALENQLKKCLCDDGHYEVYKIIANKATKEADVALQTANAAIAEAARLWGIAVDTWQPLREAVNTDDLHRRAKLAPLPPFPLSQASGAARPANVTIEEVTAA